MTMKLTPQKVIELYTASGKKHLFITGLRQVGKSTLFNKITPLLSVQGGILPGLTSYMIPQKAVMLKDNLTGREGAVGIHCPEKATIGRTMIPHSDGFFAVGIPALKEAMQSDSRWVSVDEIGFLESGEVEFQQQFFTLMEHKNVIAVIRKTYKGQVPFIDRLMERQDVFVLDLDNFDKTEYWD